MMAQKTKVIRVNGSLAIIIPKDIAESNAVQEGDELFISASSSGMIITLSDSKQPAFLQDAREFMRTHGNAFRELGK